MASMRVTTVSSYKQLLIVTIAVAVGGVFVGSPVYAQVADWNGGTGSWNTAGNWSPTAVPNGASFNVQIDNGDATNSVVTLDISATVNTLAIDNGDSLIFNNARNLTIAGATLVNDGDISILGTTNSTSLVFSNANPAISGSGEIVLNDDTQSRITGSGGTVITHAAGHTIRGGGSLLANTASMINNGTILGGGTNTALIIDPDANGFTNNGTLRATGAEGIDLNNGTFTNTATIKALDGSRVDLSSAVIVGGRLATTGTGLINIVGSSTLNGVTVAAGSTVNQNNAQTATILNGLTNNGTWNNLATTNSTNLNFSGSQTLGGTGEVVLNSDPQSRITGNGGTTVITHGADHTIRGGGFLLANSAGLINNGTILGDDGTIALVIDPAVGFTNGLTGVVQATGAAGIDLINGTFTNNSTIEVLAGSRLDLSGAIIVGGTLSSVGTGTINIVGSSTLDGVTLATGSTVNQNNAQTATILNGLTNNSTWNNLATTNTTNLNFSGSQTLDGTGEIVLNDDTQSRITGSGGTVITHTAGHTIRGGGSLLANTASMINNGTILGGGTNTALIIDPDANGFTNNGTLRATGAEGIDLNNGTFTNTATIKALDGSRVDLSSAVIVGGRLATTGTGRINIVGSSTLNGVTIADGSTVNQNNAQTATILNGLTNNGTWNNQATTNTTNLTFSGSQTLDGTGEIVLNSDPQSRITGNGGTTVITHGADHTIRGGGLLLANSAGMINNGTILGDGSIALSINPNASGFTNNGLIRADTSSTVTILAGGTFANTPGALIAGDGTIDVSAISFTNDGGVAPGTSPGILNLTGNYSESATATLFIEIAGTAVGDDYDQFAISGTASLAGTLDIDLLSFLPAPTDTFTILTTGSSISGMFSNAVGTVTTVEGHLFDVAYNSNGTGSVVLSNFVLTGDFDFDGDVDGFDFLTWQRGGSPNPLSPTDLAAWETHYGTAPGSPLAVSSSTTVPEPGTLALLTIGGVLLFCRGRVTVMG